MSRFDPVVPVIAQTILWQREDGHWNRFLIRQQKNMPPVTSALTRVETNTPTCMACLSSDVDVVDSDEFEEGELLCRSCGVRYGFIL